MDSETRQKYYVVTCYHKLNTDILALHNNPDDGKSTAENAIEELGLTQNPEEIWEAEDGYYTLDVGTYSFAVQPIELYLGPREYSA